MNLSSISSPLVGLIAHFFTLIRARWIRKQPKGNEKMTRIAGYISQGAMAFINAESKILHECDFVLKEKNRITGAIQVCWSAHNPTTMKSEVEGLVDALSCYRLSEGLILTDVEEEEFTMKDYKMIVKPTWKWLLNM